MSDEISKQPSLAYINAVQAVVDAARQSDELKKELDWIEEQQLEVFNRKRAADKQLSEAVARLKEVAEEQD